MAFLPLFLPKPMWPSSAPPPSPPIPDTPVTIDLEQQTIARGNRSFAFTIDPLSRNQLLSGSDDVDLTDSYRERVAAFKTADRERRPWAQPAQRSAN